MKKLALVSASLILLGLILARVPDMLAGKKNLEYIDGTILKEDQALKIRPMIGTTGDAYDEFHFFVQVGQVVYVGAYRKDWILQYRPKREDWPEGMPVQIRFEKKTAFGLIHTTFMYVRRPNSDKEVMTHLFSVMGPDGKQKCGHFYCN